MGDWQLWRHRRDQGYDVAADISVARSDSTTYELAPHLREPCLGDLRAFIEAEDGAFVLRPLVITLVTGRRR